MFRRGENKERRLFSAPEPLSASPSPATLARSPDARDTFLTHLAVVIFAVKPASPSSLFLSISLSLCASRFLLKKKLDRVDFACVVCLNGVRGDKKEKEKEEAKSGGIPPVIWHEIVEGHFGSYTFGGTCTQISWNELGKPSSCGIVNCRYFVVVSLILEWTIHGIA